jgi:hypothetical protein
MALTWTIDHVRRLNVATANGPVSAADLEHWIAERHRAGADGYRVIFDASRAEVDLHSAELVAFSRIAGERKADDFDGALALIASSEAECEIGAYFARRTNSERPCRVFPTVDAADAWFAELDAAARR